MKRRFKVTIGLCVKNVEQTIKEALSSVLEQDFPYKLIELIVVDGCSKDKTLSIIKEELLNTYIKHKIFGEDSGLGCARQIVVDNAEGDYIVWVDGDMVLPRDFVRKQVEFMEQNPKVGIGKAKYGMRNEGSLVATLENIEFVLSFRHEGKTTSKALATSGCIYRVKAIRQVGGFDENIKGVGEDMDAEYRIRATGWLLYITPAIFYERRRKTWKSLWDEYFWHGIGGHFIKDAIKSTPYMRIKIFPPTAVLILTLHSIRAYKIFHKKKVFLLPFHWIFKRIAWLCGFLTSS